MRHTSQIRQHCHNIRLAVAQSENPAAVRGSARRIDEYQIQFGTVVSFQPFPAIGTFHADIFHLSTSEIIAENITSVAVHFQSYYFRGNGCEMQDIYAETCREIGNACAFRYQSGMEGGKPVARGLLSA